MSKTNKNTVQKPQNASEKSARPKRTYSKEVMARARKIQAARKAEETKKAAEERRVRMTQRAEAKKKLEEAKKATAAAQPKITTRGEKPEKQVATKKTVATDVEMVDFAVTARKYKTQLTRKFEDRKFWVDPSPYEILSYIPGTIISVDVKAGKIEEEGGQLLNLEAMKMQNRVDMPFTSRIKKINVKAGERIPKDFVMIELEPVTK